MNKKELIEAISERAEFTKKDTESFLQAFVDVIEDAVAEGKKVQMIGFGSFEPRERAEREGRNPKTGEVIKIPASTVPVFKAGKEFKEKVNR